VKGGIPITIALIIVLALIIATIFYTTSRTTYVRENFYSFALNEWIIINHDLTRVGLLALVRGSQNASKYSRTYLITPIMKYIETIPLVHRTMIVR